MEPTEQEDLVAKFQDLCERKAAKAEGRTRERICSDCGGRGFKRTLVDGYEYVVKCACRKQEEHFDIIRKTGIPHKFWRCTLDPKPEDRTSKFLIGSKTSKNGSTALAAASRERALKVCIHLKNLYVEHFLKDDPKDELFGLLLYGDCGLGKTRLAASLLLDLVRAGLDTVRFIEYNELFKQIRFSYNKDGPSYQGLFEGLIRTSVLVIDDFGMEVSGDHVWVLDNIGYIINERYAMNRPTILTTNFWKPLSGEASANASEALRNINEMASWEQRRAIEKEAQARKNHAQSMRLEEAWEKVSYRLRSRISEMCLQVKLEGKDYRAHLGQKRQLEIDKALGIK